MSWTLLLLLLVVARAIDYNEQPMIGAVKFANDTCFKHILFSGYGKSYSLQLYASSHELFFSRAVRSDDLDDREIIACQFQYRTCRNIKGIIKGSSVAHAQKSNVLYFGGNNGIYKYNLTRNEAIRVAAEEERIWHIFIFENSLYYIVHPSKTLYVVKNFDFKNRITPVHVEVDIFFITNDNAIFLANMTGLYTVEKPAVPHKELLLVDNNVHVRQITQDYKNNVYFAAYEGIYINEGRAIKRVSNVRDVFGITYVNVRSPRGRRVINVILYSDERHIYRIICNYDSRWGKITFDR